MFTATTKGISDLITKLAAIEFGTGHIDTVFMYGLLMSRSYPVNCPAFRSCPIPLPHIELKTPIMTTQGETIWDLGQQRSLVSYSSGFAGFPRDLGIMFTT